MSSAPFLSWPQQSVFGINFFSRHVALPQNIYEVLLVDLKHVYDTAKFFTAELGVRKKYRKLSNLLKLTCLSYMLFLKSNTFMSNARLKLAKNQANIRNTLRLNFCYLKIIHILHPRYHPKIIGHILKNKLKNNYVCVRLYNWSSWKWRRKWKQDHRSDINRPRPRHGHKYNNYQKSLSMMMMLICIKQRLSNIWRSIH